MFHNLHCQYPEWWVPPVRMLVVPELHPAYVTRSYIIAKLRSGHKKAGCPDGAIDDQCWAVGRTRCSHFFIQLRLVIAILSISSRDSYLVDSVVIHRHDSIAITSDRGFPLYSYKLAIQPLFGGRNQRVSFLGICYWGALFIVCWNKVLGCNSVIAVSIYATDSPSMSITQYNGSAIVAMVGKDCVAIASDSRFGVQAQTVATDMQKIFKMHDRLFVGISGLVTDMITVRNKLDYRLKMYKLREDREIEPNVFANMLSGMLYEKRFGPFFTEPVVAGIDKTGKPFICAMDLIGAAVYAEDFVVAGTTSEELYGTCESFYTPNLEPDDLFETVSQALLAAVDRDCLAGWGAVVHIMTKEGVTTRKLKSRQD